MLYEPGIGRNRKAVVMVHHLRGAMDAGDAGQMAVDQILSSLPTQTVATFDSDALVDYRSRRPIVSIENWVVSDIEEPRITLSAVTDYSGQDFLLLHGVEPDFKWREFSSEVLKLAEYAGVEKTVDIMGVPAAVPHTRTPIVNHTASRRELVSAEDAPAGQMRVVASVGAYLQMVLAEAGFETHGLLATVPYYLSDNLYPATASKLLQRLGTLAGLELPLGDLEEMASAISDHLEGEIEDSPQLAQLVSALEEQYDKIFEDFSRQVGAGTAGIVTEGDIADELARKFEEFLAFEDRDADGYEIPKHRLGDGFDDQGSNQIGR
ncbi:MAG: PAC2 family protein [Varibaculum sp.]|nr:PAC2 family protein [Varibaculum sp.]